MAKTKIVANYLRKVTNEDGNLEVTFEVSITTISGTARG